jgi:D-3-phosphoglycerate dehydrogenase
MPSVLITTSSFGGVSPEPIDRLRAAGFSYRLNPFGRRLERQESMQLLPGFDALIAGTETLNREVLDSTSELRIVSRCGTGLENVDLEAARELGVVVTNTSRGYVEAVAELALGGILDLLRSISSADRELRRGTWHKPMGRLLRGKSVGIIGLGRIGKTLVRLLAPFAVKILACDPRPDLEFAQIHGISYRPLEEILPLADIVTLHLPLTPETEGLLDRQTLEAMRPGAILVNCARGGLVDEEALRDLLENEHLGGAFLDVYSTEPYAGPLIDVRNVLLTPHIGSYAAEGRLAMENQAVDSVLEFFAEGSKG